MLESERECEREIRLPQICSRHIIHLGEKGVVLICETPSVLRHLRGRGGKKERKREGEEEGGREREGDRGEGGERERERGRRGRERGREGERQREREREHGSGLRGVAPH